VARSNARVTRFEGRVGFHEALREVAFKERCKIHDLVMEGIGLALRKRGFHNPSSD